MPFSSLGIDPPPSWWTSARFLGVVADPFDILHDAHQQQAIRHSPGVTAQSQSRDHLLADLSLELVDLHVALRDLLAVVSLRAGAQAAGGSCETVQMGRSTPYPTHLNNRWTRAMVSPAAAFVSVVRTAA